MAKYKITTDDGSIYNIEATDDATEQEVSDYFNNEYLPSLSNAQEQPVETPVAQTPEQPVAEQSDISFTDKAYQSAKETAQAFIDSPIESVRKMAYDRSLAVSKGLLSVPEFITGIADMASNGQVGKYLEDKGVNYQTAKEYLTSQQSPEERAAAKEREANPTFSGTVESMLTNPSSTVNAALESLPASYVGGRIGSAVQGIKALGKASGMLGAGAGELIVGSGQAEEGIRQQTPDRLTTPEQSALALGAGTADAFLAGIGSVAAKKLGIADIDTLRAGARSAEMSIRDMAKQILGSMGIEGGEELTQSSAEQIIENYALDKPSLFEGVPNAAATGMITGMAMGGGHALTSTIGESAQTVTGDELLRQRQAEDAKNMTEDERNAYFAANGGKPQQAPIDTTQATTEQATPTSDQTTSTLQEYENIFTDENLTRKGNAPDTNEPVVNSEAPIVDNQKIDEEIGKTTNADDAIKAFTDIVEANSIGSEINMEYANKIADRFTKTKEVEITDKDYQDAVQLEQQLSTVRDELAYRKFQKGYEQAKQEEVDDLIAQEINDKNQQLAQILEQQRTARVESSIPSINQTIENEQWAKTRNNRNSVIQMVFDRDIPAENIFPAIKAELKRQGFKDTEINQDDIDAYNLLKATPTTPVLPTTQAPEMIPPTENEMNVEGLIKEKVEPVISEQVSPALRKVDEWVNNGATYKNGMLIDSKGKKFLLNKAQREYYLISRSNPLATTPVDMGNQLPLTTQRDTDQITGITEEPKPPTAETPTVINLKDVTKGDYIGEKNTKDAFNSVEAGDILVLYDGYRIPIKFVEKDENGNVINLIPYVEAGVNGAETLSHYDFMDLMYPAPIYEPSRKNTSGWGSIEKNTFVDPNPVSNAPVNYEETQNKRNEFSANNPSIFAKYLINNDIKKALGEIENNTISKDDAMSIYNSAKSTGLLTSDTVKELSKVLTPTAETPEEQPTTPVENKKPYELTREEYVAKFPNAKEDGYDAAIHNAVTAGKMTQEAADKVLIRTWLGGKEFWAKTRKELEQEKKDTTRNLVKQKADAKKNPTYNVKWAQRSDDISRKNAIEQNKKRYDELLAIHKERVQEALDEGKPVPKEVLADYPDLKLPTPTNQAPVAETVKTGTVENPILRKNGRAFTSSQGAQTHIRTNPELSKETHTWVKLGDEKYGIVTRDQVVKKTTNPAENLNKVTGFENVVSMIGKLGGLSRVEMSQRDFDDYKGNTRLFNNGVRSRTFDDMATVLRVDHGFDEIKTGDDLDTILKDTLRSGKPYYGYEGIDNAMDKIAADKADQDQQEQDELLNTYTNEELNAILDAKTQAEKDQLIKDIKAEKKRKADQEVDSVVDEMLGKGKTTTMDIFTPERKGKVAVGREVTVEGEQLANSGTKVRELYPNHWFYGDKGAQDKFNDTEIDYEGEYPNLESISLINTDSNIGGFYDQVEKAIYQTAQSDRTTLHELGHAVHHQLLNYRKLSEDERATLKELILGDEQANHPYLASDKELVAEFNLYAHLFPVKAKAYAPKLYKELVAGRKEVVIKLGSQESKGLTQALKQANVTIEKGYGEEEEPIANKYKRKEYTEEERASQKKYRLTNFERARSEIDALQEGLGFTLLDESDDYLLYSKYNGSSPHLIQYSLVTKNMSPPIGSMFVFNGAGELIASRLNYHKTAREIYGKDKADDMMSKSNVDDKQVLESLKDKIGEGDIFPEDSNFYNLLRRPTSSSLDSIDPLETEEGRIKQIENMLKGRIVPKSNIKFSKAKAQERLAPNGKPSNLNATQYEQVRTPEFKEWFGDWENDPENASKVVDENGEPLVVYHGSQTPTFTEFEPQGAINLFGKDNGFYFTTSPVEASAYANENADNLSKGRKGVGAVMPVYLNIKNVANITEDAWNVDDVNVQDYLENMDGEGLLSDIKNNYDGILYDGSVLPIPVKEGAEHFVAFNPNQIKSATGNTGEFSKESNDIRFSKAAKKVLDDNPLAIVHNLNLKNLAHADKMGGLPAPSIAVVNQKYPLSGFGEITLIGDTSQFAPEADKANRFYNADVYSPRYPNVTYTVDSKAVSNANEALSDDTKVLANAIGRSGLIDKSSIEDKGLVDGLGNNLVLQYEFLKTIGKAPKMQYKPNKVPPANMKKFIASKVPAMELKNDPNFIQGVVDNHNESVRKRNEILNQNRPYLEVESQQASNLAVNYQYDIEEFRNQKGAQKSIDTYATSKLIREKTNRAQYEKWLVENYSNLITDERIFNGFTNAGNRIYLPHNLDTVVKLMTKTVKGGENVSYGIGTIRAHTAKQFKTVKAIQAARGDIVSAEKLEALKEELSNEFENLSEELRPYSDYSNPSATDALSDLVSKGTRAFKESYQDVPAETMTKVYDFLDKLKNMPAHYFEGKIGRAVKLNEFAGALVPKGKDYDEAVKILNANGITKIKRYTEGDSQSRSDALLNFSEVLFSQTQEPTVNNHTEQSLKEGLTQAGDDAYGKGWTNRLLATGMFEFISDADAQAIVEEAAEVSYSKNGDIEAFFNPADGKTYFVAENIDKATDLHYLMMHEVGVHALNMGGNKEEFESILKQVDNLVKVKNPAALKGRQDALDADTPQEDLREETLAYLLKYAPKLKVVDRFKAWLKNALRNMSKMFPASQKLGFIQWANKLSDQDLLYIANATLRKAPEMLGANKREANSFIAKASKALSAEQMRALGQLDLLEFIQEIADMPRENSRVGMPHEQILQRVPELTESAKKMMDVLYDNNMLNRDKNGNLIEGVSSKDVEDFARSNPEFRKLAEAHDALVEKYKPVEPYQSLPTPATEAEMQGALNDKQAVNINQPIPDGYKVKLRLDIPAYKRFGVWVVTAHEGNTKKNSIFGVDTNKPIGYYSHAVGNNPKFSIDELGALKIADKTRDKYPLATVDAEYVNMSAQEAKRLADEALDKSNWIQVGMDPERHSYFYDRKTMQPVLSGSRVIQIGSILMVENPVFGNKKSFLFSKNAPSQNPDGTFNIPAETSFQFLRKWIQDDLLRIRVVMDRVREQGGKVDESNDVVLAMEAAGNIAANQLEKLKERYIQPLIDRMAKMNVNKDEIGLLLYAKHAPERNAYIQSINPKFRKLGEGGSGMTDAESAAIIQRYKDTMGDKYAEFEKLTDDWQNIQTIVKNILVASGDISPEQAQSWEDGFDYHVPLKGFEEVDEVTGKAKKSSRGNIGQGFSISGKFDRKMLGRQSRANQIVENIVMNLERAVIRSSKMYVQSTLYKLVEDNPDINLWENEVTPMKPIMGKAKAQYVMYFHGSEIGVRDTLRDARRYVEAETARTGQEKREYEIVKVGGEPQVTLMRKPYDQNEEISYWRNGKQVRIVVNDEAFVQAFNRLGDENIYSMFKVMAAFNRFLRHSYTILNPAFIIANGVMVDPAVALYTNTARQGFKYASTVLAKTPMASLQIAKYMAKGSSGNAEWDNAIRLYYDNGGKSGAAFISSIEQKADELNLAVLKSKILDTKFYEYPLDKLKLMVVENKLANLLKYLGEVGETATRLSTFKVAIDNGKSPQEAAKIARNVTINFNRRGVVGRELGAMYLFLNASIQGTENLVDATINGEHKVQAAAMLSTYVTLGYLIALLGGDDGDDDLIPEEEKTRFLSVTLDEKTGLRVDWKLPYGLSFWKDVGTAIARVQLGGDPEKITNKLMSSFFNNFSYVNPMVSGEWNAKDLISGLIPTAGRIPYSIYNNRNQWGKPIYPEDTYKTTVPDSEKEWSTTRGTLFSDFAKWMNKVTGGTKVESGLIDVSPESMKYTLNALTGSVGTQAYKFLNSLYTSSMNAEEMSVGKLPLVSNFVKEDTIDAYRRVYTTQRKEAKDIYDKFKKYEKLDDEAATDKFVARHQTMLDFYDETKSIIKEVEDLRDKQDEARIEGDKQLLKELENDEKELLIEYNYQYNRR